MSGFIYDVIFSLAGMKPIPVGAKPAAGFAYSGNDSLVVLMDQLPPDPCAEISKRNDTAPEREDTKNRLPLTGISLGR